MKRWIAALLTLVMIVSVVPFGAVAESDVGQALAKVAAEALEQENGTAVATGTCGDNLTWSLSDDGTLTISGTGDMYNYNDVAPYNISPWYHDLTSSNSGGYSGVSIKNVIIREGVTSIGDNAFLGCGKISSIEFPDSLTSIGKSAFNPSPALNEVTLPPNLVDLGAYAFAGGNFSSIEIPEGVTSIKKYTFSGCKKLISIQLSSGLVSIDDGAFNKCTELSSIQIPNTISTLGNFTFMGCTSLTSLEIPNGVTCIPKSLLDGCSSLSSITIPKSVTSVEDSAFYGCTSLTDVYFEGTQSQWDAISLSNYQNDPLKTATIHYLSTGPESEKTFTFKRDNLSFLNHQDYFFQGEELGYWSLKRKNPSLAKRLFALCIPVMKQTNQYASVHLTKEKFDQLTRNLSPNATKYIEQKVCSGEAWGGSCYGMVVAAAIHYMEPSRLPFSQLTSTGLNDSSSNYELPAPVNNQDVENLVNYYWATQFLPTRYRIWSNCLYNCAHNYDNVLKEIITSLGKSVPVIVDLPDHAIMLVDVKENKEDSYVLGVYNPNEFEEQELILYKTPYYDKDGDGYLKIKFGNYDHADMYTLASDLDYIDIRNYFNIGEDHETLTDYNDAHITIYADGNNNVVRGNQYYYRTENGELVEKDPSVRVLHPAGYLEGESSSSAVELVFPKPSSSDDITLEFSSSDVSNADILLNNTLLSISTSGPVKLTYNEDARTVDVTAENPTDVNLLFTQNTPDEAWPWNTWAIDTTNTTKLHASLDEDGLHLTGDGISGAKVATEKVTEDESEEDEVATITLPVKAEGETTQEVTISNKKDEMTNDDKLTIDGSGSGSTDPSEPSKPDTPTTPTNPTAPSGGSGSGSGDGGAGALLLVGGAAAAAAITAGVVLSLPVEIQGKAELADHTPLAGAKISLLKDGKVVEQTTADDAGAFSVKVKRGEYQLTAAYTNADGQIIHQTVNIKAPAKDLTITF